MEQPAAADDGGRHGDHRVFGGGADEADRPLLDGGQNGVGLGLAPAMALVQKQIGRLSIELQPVLRLPKHLAHVGNAAGDGVKFDERRPRRLGNDGREGRLAAAGRAPEDGAGQAVGLDGAPQQLARADNLCLAHEFVQRPRAHAVGQRRERPRVHGKEIVHAVPP